MAATKCKETAFITYTPESTTFIAAEDNIPLWMNVVDMVDDIYKGNNPSPPKKKHPHWQQFLQKLKDYSHRSKFVVELPSVMGVPCKCLSVTDKNLAYGQHSLGEVRLSNPTPTVRWFETSLQSSLQAFEEAYDVLRRPAKEILLTVASDLNRKPGPLGHAVPIQYGLSGFSLSMETVRNFLTDAIVACLDKGLSVRAISFDGQFSELTTNDASRRPLTLLAFMKQHWENVKRMKREAKMDFLLNLCNIPQIDCEEYAWHYDVTRSGANVTVGLKTEPIKVYSPQNIRKICKVKVGDECEQIRVVDGPCSVEDYEAALVSLIAYSTLKKDQKWN